MNLVFISTAIMNMSKTAMNKPPGLRTGLIGLIFILTACTPQEKPLHHETILAFGTLIEVSIAGVDEAQAQKGFDALRSDFNYMQEVWNPVMPNPVMRINGLLQTGIPFSVSPSTLPLIQRAQELSVASNGLFNPAIGKLIKLWGFQDDTRDNELPPDKDEILKLVNQHPAMADIIIKGITLQGKNPAVSLDFGAFAKGYGVDVGIKHLRDLGIHNAIINAGGDIRAMGKRGRRPWRIGIRDPRKEGVIASIDMGDDESIFTSGDYERFFEYEGKRYHHIIDPRTGYPADHTRSVTVIHTNGAEADAAATALFVAGPKEWHAIAKAMNIKYVMLIDNKGIVYMNPAMAKRIQFEVTPLPEIRLSPPL